MSLAPHLIYVVPALLGIMVVAALQLTREKIILILIGTTVGLATFTTAAYIASAIIPFSAPSVLALLGVISILTFASLILTRTLRTAVTHIRTLPLDTTAAAIFLATLALFSLIGPKLLIAQPDGLYTGIINAYGDVAWHAANITAFAEGQTIPPQNPSFAGTTLAYPFLTNFLSALLVATGATLPMSVNVPATLLPPLVLTLLYCFVRELTNQKSAGVIAFLLFLFGGATFGIVRFPADWQASGVSLIEFLLELPARDYSGVGTDSIFHFLNPATTLLLPQRSFLIALPLALSILTLLLPHRPKPATAYLLAGILAGLTPLFHAHTALALTPAIISFFILDRQQWRQWFLFLLPALAIGLPEIIYYARAGSETDAFLRFGPRWMAGEHNLIWYWFVNTGLFIPSAIAALLIPAPRILGQAARPTKALALSGLLIFIIANLFLFAPWAWDNFKLFVYFFVFVVPLVSSLAAKLVIGPPAGGWSLVIRGTVVAVLALHILSAALDIWKLTLPSARTWNEFTAEGIAFAEQVQRFTRPGDTIATAPTHNSPIVLTGRLRYLGFAAHVWSHGGNPWPREAALKEFYEGRLTTLPEHTPDFVLVGPQERLAYPALVISPTWQLVTQLGQYTLYRLE